MVKIINKVSNVLHAGLALFIRSLVMYCQFLSSSKDIVKYGIFTKERKQSIKQKVAIANFSRVCLGRINLTY